MPQIPKAKLFIIFVPTGLNALNYCIEYNHKNYVFFRFQDIHTKYFQQLTKNFPEFIFTTLVLKN